MTINQQNQFWHLLIAFVVSLIAIFMTIRCATPPAHAYYQYECVDVECGPDGYVIGDGWGA